MDASSNLCATDAINIYQQGSVGATSLSILSIESHHGTVDISRHISANATGQWASQRTFSQYVLIADRLDAPKNP
ncbi:hypothetical protein OXX79_012460 [Metschnikowia pulcherrima]